MGIKVTTIYFEDVIPNMEKIKDKYNELTGLSVYVTAQMHLLDLPTNSRQVYDVLRSDFEKYEKWQEYRERTGHFEIAADFNFLGGFSFYCPDFYEIEFTVSDHKIELWSYLGCYYFIESLTKTFFELGGQLVDFEGKVYERHPRKEWGKLKRWDEYRWFNKPQK